MECFVYDYSGNEYLIENDFLKKDIQKISSKEYIEKLLKESISMLEDYRISLQQELEKRLAEQVLNELIGNHKDSNYEELKKYFLFNQYICESLKRIKLEVISSKRMEQYTDASIFATKETLYITEDSLFLSYIDEKLQLLFALLMPYGNVFFNTKVQRFDRTIQIATMLKYLYQGLPFEFEKIIKYSQTNHRLIKGFLLGKDFQKSVNSEAKIVIRRFLNNISDLNNFKDLFNLYKWKKAAYDLYSNLIVTNDNYFHKVFENIGYAWGFPIEKSGPVGFLSNNIYALKTLKINDNEISISNKIVMDKFSKETIQKMSEELIQYQKEKFADLGIIF